MNTIDYHTNFIMKKIRLQNLMGFTRMLDAFRLVERVIYM